MCSRKMHLRYLQANMLDIWGFGSIRSLLSKLTQPVVQLFGPTLYEMLTTIIFFRQMLI